MLRVLKVAAEILGFILMMCFLCSPLSMGRLLTYWLPQAPWVLIAAVCFTPGLVYLFALFDTRH